MPVATCRRPAQRASGRAPTRVTLSPQHAERFTTRQIARTLCVCACNRRQILWLNPHIDSPNPDLLPGQEVADLFRVARDQLGFCQPSRSVAVETGNSRHVRMTTLEGIDAK